jgi:hypothetical protein
VEITIQVSEFELIWQIAEGVKGQVHERIDDAVRGCGFLDGHHSACRRSP